ncbi:MAG: alpha/beta hydrolase [Acidimicrobiales bacterium]|jgi:peroxiredoxin|nr:alpha/beta hydrolase [Acidimicrobiales bacterium]MDP6298134.1 alpha/beta hydrolase [Acidimicrobiales bacterium]HJM29344.1 alpha/beta hydrolase [Acidimicrobiales bacterium]HJM96677.1 alpha/beta hydrolase [Acidimicrobiales bacterium]
MGDLYPLTKTFTTSSGLAIEVDLWGSASEKSVLLLHGGGQTRHSWDATARRLASNGIYAITLDLRGHGRSGWSSNKQYQLGQFSEDVVHVLQELRIHPVLVGASLGGLVGMYLEGKVRPNSITSLVLVDIVPNMNLTGAEKVKDFMMKYAETGFTSLTEVAEVLADYNPHRKKPTDLEGLKKNLRKRGDRWFWHWDPNFISSERTDANPDMRNPQLLNEVCQNIEVPILLVRGKMSDLVTSTEAQEFLKEHPQAEFVDVSGAGHMVAGDRNDVFAEEIIKFLDGVWK